MKRYLTRFWLLMAALLLVAGCNQEQKQSQQSQKPSQAASEASSPAVADEAISAEEPSAAAQAESDRLGTQWGEGIDSKVTTVDLRRVSSSPLDVIQIYYAASRQSGRSVREAMIANGRIGVSILTDHNSKWPLKQNGSQLYLKGEKGERYQLSYRNYSNKIYEIIATVDGLDVLNGSAGSLSNAGYVLKPNDTLRIEGFRKSDNEVAAFRFAEVADAYAANTPSGSPSNTGVIGTAVFELNAPTAPPVDNQPQAFPGDKNGYAPGPSYNN